MLLSFAVAGHIWPHSSVEDVAPHTHTHTHTLVCITVRFPPPLFDTQEITEIRNQKNIFILCQERKFSL